MRVFNKSTTSRDYQLTRTDRPWQKEENFCQTCVLRQHEFRHGVRMLNFIELSIFDFLLGLSTQLNISAKRLQLSANWDRHDTTSFFFWEKDKKRQRVIDTWDAFIIAWDQGRAYVFDVLIRNESRHYVHSKLNYSFHVTHSDDVNLLAPLTQCCYIF